MSKNMIGMSQKRGMRNSLIDKSVKECELKIVFEKSVILT